MNCEDKNIQTDDIIPVICQTMNNFDTIEGRFNEFKQRL